MFEQYYRNATQLVVEDPASGSTFVEIPRVFADKKFRDLKISRCKNPIIVQFWRKIAEAAGGEASLENVVPYITSKFDVFLTNDIMRPIVAQEKSAFDFREIMDGKKIFLANLSRAAWETGTPRSSASSSSRSSSRLHSRAPIRVEERCRPSISTSTSSRTSRRPRSAPSSQKPVNTSSLSSWRTSSYRKSMRRSAMR